MRNDLEKINKDQRLYVIKSGNGFSCYGFDVLDEKIKKLCIDLNIVNPIKRKGTKKAYGFYNKLLFLVHKRFKETGKKSNIELIPEFIGNERRKVKVIDRYGETRTFIIGKSTGFIPCHLEIKRIDSSGGGSVYGYPFKSIVFLN
jgi:hypothetical protein